MTSLNRRDVLKIGAAGVGVAALGMTLPLGEAASTADWISTAPKPARFARRMPLPPVLVPTPMSDEHGDFWHFDLTERSASAQVLDPGSPPTTVFGYAAPGAAPTVPGPLIRVPQNTRVRLRVANDLELELDGSALGVPEVLLRRDSRWRALSDDAGSSPSVRSD